MKNSFPVQIHNFFCSCLLILFCSSVYAQTDTDISGERDYKVRPIRLGVKIGFPNLIGGNVEYVTPLLDDKLAVNFDYSMLKMGWFISEEDYMDDPENTDLNLSYFEGGINYYFFKAGKGLYGNLSYGVIKVDGTTDVTSDGRPGVGYLNVSHGSVNVKLGAKLGGLFYFRPEIGYAFNSLPKAVEYEVKYEDGTTEKDFYDFTEEVASAEILFKGFMANIGFGFAF